MTRWRTFGRGPAEELEDAVKPAPLGFALSSPLFALSEGVRRITVEPGDDGLVASLLLGVEDRGQLRYAGKVGGGWTEALRKRLTRELEAHAADAALIACDDEGDWVRSGLFCRVSYLETTSNGTFRAPVFQGLVAAD